MKHLLPFSLLLLFLLHSATTCAYDFEVDGIYYNIKGNNVIVTYAELSPSADYYHDDITIPSTVTYNGTTYTVTVIGDNAFAGCLGLTSVTIPNTVTRIGGFAFYSCTGLKSVAMSNSVTFINGYAFQDCSGLTSVTIPSSVTTIGYGAFAGCIGLTSITVDSSNTTFDSRDDCNAIINTSSNTLVLGCKNTIIPNSVTAIGNWAFWGCSGLTSVTIPNSVNAISDGAFRSCTGLTSIVVDSGNATFDSRDDCNAIINTSSNTLVVGCKNTVIPNSVTAIGNDAFNGCSELTSMTIPNSVNAIGNNAFYECSGLTSVTIPRSVSSIGDWAFSSCTGLTSIIVDGSNTTFDSRDDCNAIINTSSNTLVVGCKNTVIPSSVTAIGGLAFYGCCGLTNVTIPNSVTSIDGGAFAGCIGLTNATIGNSLTHLGSYAFSGCSGLTSVTIPNSVTSIEYGAFWSCTGLNNVYSYIDDLSTISMGNSVFSNSLSPSERTLHVPVGTSAAYEADTKWSDFFGSIVEMEQVPGDVNGDGNAGIDDVTALIDLLLYGGATITDYPSADVNGDGCIDIGDVTSLIDKLLWRFNK